MCTDCTPDTTDAVVVLSLLRDKAWVVSVAVDCVCALVVAQVYVCYEDIEGRRENLPKVSRKGISQVEFGSFVGNAYKTSLSAPPDGKGLPGGGTGAPGGIFMPLKFVYTGNEYSFFPASSTVFR